MGVQGNGLISHHNQIIGLGYRIVDSNLSPRNRELLIVAALLALGLLTRFFGIDHQSIWIDEGSTFYFSHYTWDQFATPTNPTLQSIT